MPTPRSIARIGAVWLLGTVAALPAGAQDAPLNPIIERLQQDETATGTFTRTASPDDELDFAVIDLQYAEFDIDVIHQAVAGMRAGNAPPSTAPIVRIPIASSPAPQAHVAELLDAGVFGIMFPDIETPEQAATAVASMRWTGSTGATGSDPAGERRDGRGSAPQVWGLDAAAYRGRADVWPLAPSGELVAMLQIESLRGIENLEAILDVPGIGVIFLGPTDLAKSADEEGPNAPRVEALVQQVLAACLEHDIACGYPIVAPTPEDAERETARRVGEGFKVLAVMTTAR